MDAKPQDVETDTRSVKRRISKAWDRCGTLPAREAVKVVPRDWHWFRDVTEALVSERDAQAAEITALRAELADARLQTAGGDMLIHAANLERDALAARLAVPGEEEAPDAE